MEEMMSTEESEPYPSEEYESERESELEEECDDEVRVTSSSCIAASESSADELDAPFCSS